MKILKFSWEYFSKWILIKYPLSKFKIYFHKILLLYTINSINKYNKYFSKKFISIKLLNLLVFSKL